MNKNEGGVRYPALNHELTRVALRLAVVRVLAILLIAAVLGVLGTLGLNALQEKNTAAGTAVNSSVSVNIGR